MTTGCTCASCGRGLAHEPGGECAGCQIDAADSRLARTVMRLREWLLNGPHWDTRQRQAEIGE